jgi:hypothetical protein
MKDEFKPHILGMCETFLNEEKCKMNSRELDLDNFTYNVGVKILTIFVLYRLS